MMDQHGLQRPLTRADARWLAIQDLQRTTLRWQAGLVTTAEHDAATLETLAVLKLARRVR